jgi:hypothetical protein
MPRTVSEEVLISLGELKSTVVDLRGDVEILHRCWKEIVVEQGASKDAMRRLTDNVENLQKQVQTVDTAVKPLVEWHRTGVRVFVILSGAASVAAVLFGPTLQHIGDGLVLAFRWIMKG